MHLGSVFIAALLVSACSGEAETPAGPAKSSSAPAACVQRPRAWPSIEPDSFLTGIGGLVFFEVEVGADAALKFNGEATDLATLRETLRVTGQLQPWPPLVLRTSGRSHCETAEDVRASFDALQQCREGYCFESARWEALGLPGFAEHRDRFSEIERRRR